MNKFVAQEACFQDVSHHLQMCSFSFEFLWCPWELRDLSMHFLLFTLFLSCAPVYAILGNYKITQFKVLKCEMA